MESEHSKTDIMYEITYNPNFVPKRFPKANVKIVTIEGEKKYFLKNHETGGLYDLSEFGNDLWNLIDGKRTVKEMIQTMQGSYKDLQPGFVKESLLYYAGEGVLQSSTQPARRKRVDIVSAFMVRVKLIEDSKNFIQSVHRAVRPLLRRSLLWPVLVLITIMGLLFAGSFVSIFGTKENFEMMGSTIVGFFFYYFVVLGPVIAFHEIAHALALCHYGGAPREMGTGLYFFGPMFYVDVTDSWTLSRYERIMIYAAGSIAEMLVASAIMVSQFIWQFPAPISHVLTMAVFYCFYGLLIDLSPLLETDGYFMLCDGLRIPDLRAKSFGYVQKLAKRLFRRPVEKESETLTPKMKVILLVYAVLAVVWAVYLVFRSLMIATYMAQDTATSVLNVSSAILLSTLTIGAVVLCVASILYFSMVMSGYGLMIYAGMKKAVKATLRFEEISDRGLSVFLYLPKNVSQSLLNSLRAKMTKAAKSFTRNFRVLQDGSMCTVVLRMSGVKLAFVQVKEHFQKIEEKFGKIYSDFLNRHRNEVLETVGAHDPREANLAALLLQMARQANRASIHEAKHAVSEVVERQVRNALYLLHSVYGRVWTIELPPNLLHELGETLLPTLLVEDLSVTNLYDEVEDFKKRTIYGFDSLANLTCDSQAGLQEALDHPEEYQIISSFEPAKGRLIFVGRTERIENIIDCFGGLFVCQTWCGYLDNLLSEVNLSLLSLSRVSMPEKASVQSMKDGELAVLDKNISSLIAHKQSVKESWGDSKKHLKYANLELEELKKKLKPTGDFKIGMFETTLQINAENLAHLPSQLENFKALSQQLYGDIQKIGKAVKRELDKRKTLTAKKRRVRLLISPLFIALSAVLAFLGLWTFTGYVTIAFLVSALLLQVSYWATYLLFSRSFTSVGRYPSLAFRQTHFFTLAFTESLYEFMATANFLTLQEQASRTNEKK
jgi:putative peptide zinc metalloprotease protein